MNYLITAAGRGSRFLEKGLKPPKPLIKTLGNELLIWSMNSFEFTSEDSVYLVTYKEHKVKNRLENKIKNLYPHVKIFWLELENILRGQLLTTIEAIKYFNIKGPLLIHNCDTSHKFDLETVYSCLRDEIFGIIPCFKGKGDHWSFAKTENDNSSFVVEVREKKRISENCSVGTYFFSSSSDLLLIAEEYLNIKNDFEEYFIAPIYQYAINKKYKVKISNAKDVKIFGTPEELLRSFGVSHNELLGENAWNGHQTKTLIVDIDKTLCTKKEYEDYSKALPIKKVSNALRKADKEGVYIILFTSRNMRSFNGSLGLINKITSPILLNWLRENSIPFDEIYFGKPWGNSVHYVDDKTLLIEDLIKNYADG